MTTRSGRAACGLIGLLLAACGPPTYSDFVDELNSQWCKREVRCGVRGDGQPGCSPPPAFVMPRSSVDLRRSIDDGRMRYDSFAAKRCIEAIETSPCDPALLVAHAQSRCAIVIAPRVDIYGECFGSEECVGGRCQLADGDCRGLCQPYLPEGGACSPVNPTCDPSVHYCADGICRHRGARNALCTDDGACNLDLRCVDGRCAPQPRPGRGQACDALRLCSDGTYCTAGLCQPRLGDGEPCVEAGACKSGLLCAGLSAAGPGRCTPAALDGGPCVGGAEVTGCPASMSCTNDQCVPLPPVAGWNESCVSAPCRDELHCIATSCILRVGVGGRCDDDGVCQDGLTCQASECLPPLCRQP